MSVDTKALAARLFGGNKLKEAKAGYSSEWFKPGCYAMRINRVKLDQNRKNETFLFVECTVVHVYDDDEGDGHRLGAEATNALKASQDSFLGNVKSFLMGATDTPEDQITEDDIDFVLGEDQPLAGTVVEVKNVLITTRAGKPFTRVGFLRPIPFAELKEAMTEEAAARFYKDGFPKDS